MERTGFEQWKPREVARLLALVETERRYYQEMVAALPVALAVLAQDRAIVSANRAFRQLVHLTGDELRQKNIDQILPSEELTERIRSAHVHGDTGIFFIGTGERRFRVAAVPIRGWEDEMQAETLLMVEPADLETLPPVERSAPAPSADLSALPAVVWQADAVTFAFTYVGGAAGDLLGYPAAHWLAEPVFFWERIHPDDRAEVTRLYQSVAATGGEAAAEFRALNASGDSVWRRETIRVPAPGEGSRSISGVMTAIGERRQLEGQTLQAARIDALRGLASRLAHDLNNPLMIVSGYTEDLLSGLPAEAPAHAGLTEILAASTRMTDMAGALLGFTRSQAKPASKIPLTEVLEALEPRLRELSADLGIAFPAGPVWTFADAEQLEDAVAVLAAFALRSAGPASRLTLTCHTARIAERVASATLAPGLYARLDIHSPGAAAPAQPVFESMLSNPAVARVYLNLRQWGGDALHSADAQQGSTFTLYLPYAEPPYVEPIPEPAAGQTWMPPGEAVAPAETIVIEPAEPEPEPAPPVPEPEPVLATILVVEDEPGIRGLVRKILRREHYEVLEAGSGEEALTEASAEDVVIDLLLTDVMLPGIGGRELAEKLTALNPDLKVVYVSGFTADEDVRAGQFPPGSSFLQKPFTLSALVGSVKDALGR